MNLQLGTQPRWRRLAQSWLWDAAAMGLALWSVTRLGWVLPARATQIDFAHYYVTSRLEWDGQNPFVTFLEPVYRAYWFEFEPEVAGATNPPPVQWLFLPLALLPPRVAFWLWVGAQSVFLVMAVAATSAVTFSQRFWLVVAYGLMKRVRDLGDAVSQRALDAKSSGKQSAILRAACAGGIPGKRIAPYDAATN